MNQAYLILGSNIDPEKNIPLALQTLAEEPEISVIQNSSIWITEPVGSSANDFYNLAVEINTPLNAYDLKEMILCNIEEKLCRVRVEDKYAPRTIDLDIVIFNGEVLDPALFKFDYLILPFAELIPDFVTTEHNLTIKELATAVSPVSSAKKNPLIQNPDSVI